MLRSTSRKPGVQVAAHRWGGATARHDVCPSCSGYKAEDQYDSTEQRRRRERPKDLLTKCGHPAAHTTLVTTNKGSPIAPGPASSQQGLPKVGIRSTSSSSTRETTRGVGAAGNVTRTSYGPGLAGWADWPRAVDGL